MIFRVALFLIALHIGLSGLTAEARALRCDSVFFPTARDVLEQTDAEHSLFLFQTKSVQEYSETLSWRQKRKVRGLLQKIEYRDLASPQAVERYAIELSAALFGSKNNFSQWFKSPEQRLEESTLLHIKEQILREGFLKTWEDTHNPAHTSLLKKMMDRLQGFQQGRIGQLMGLPFVLPKIKDREISSELLHKVIRDGFDAHAEEVRVALRTQNYIDAYNTFRRIYAPAVFGVLMAMNAQQAYTQIQAAIEDEVNRTIAQLQEQRALIEKNIPLIKKEQYQQIYDSAIAEFIQKWGEAPTAEEQALIKAKIEKALNIP